MDKIRLIVAVYMVVLSGSATAQSWKDVMKTEAALAENCAVADGEELIYQSYRKTEEEEQQKVAIGTEIINSVRKKYYDARRQAINNERENILYKSIYTKANGIADKIGRIIDKYGHLSPANQGYVTIYTGKVMLQMYDLIDRYEKIVRNIKTSTTPYGNNKDDGINLLNQKHRLTLAHDVNRRLGKINHQMQVLLWTIDRERNILDYVRLVDFKTYVDINSLSGRWKNIENEYNKLISQK